MAEPQKGATLEEIYGLPRAVHETLLRRESQDLGPAFRRGSSLDSEWAGEFERITIVGSGSSWHAALIGKFMIEELARVPVQVEFASEFDTAWSAGKNELTILISKSGETAEIVRALDRAKETGSTTLAICNAAGSTLARRAQGTFIVRPEVETGQNVENTLTSQLTAILLVAIRIGQLRNAIRASESERLLQELAMIPAKLETILASDAECADLAQELSLARSCLLFGRGIHYAIALEGALTLKKTSRLHAEGFRAGEMEQGVHALLDDCRVPIIVIATQDRSRNCQRRFEKMLSDIEGFKAHDGTVIAIACIGDKDIASRVDQTVYIPSAPELLLPIVEIMPLQLMAYHIARVRSGSAAGANAKRE